MSAFLLIFFISILSYEQALCQDKSYASVQEKEGNKSNEHLEVTCFSKASIRMYDLKDFQNKYGRKKLKTETIGQNRFVGISEVIGSGFIKYITSRTPTNISDITSPIGITSRIEHRNKRDKNAEDAGLCASQAISIEFTIVALALVIGFTCLVLGITVGVCIKCCACRRLHRWNRATESRTVDHSNDSIDSDSHCNRRNRRSNKIRSVAIVNPQQAVNEMPSTGSVGSEMSVDGYSNFSSSIYHDLESHDTTNTDDEETTLLKSLYSQEVTDSDE